MANELYSQFPHIETERILIRRMEEGDLDALRRITGNDLVYRWSPHFLYHQSDKQLLSAIANLGGQDFEKKRWIIAAVCRPEAPQQMLGTAEIFNYDRQVNMVEIGYRMDPAHWGEHIATDAVAALCGYLFDDIGIDRIQAFVMPENAASERVLLKNGFQKEGLIRRGNVWTGHGIVDLELLALLRDDAL
ncbi:MAG: GNAT family protein [Eubacteriales bacterium]|nr:GNAT family protein [Eubacteriales bacterium]